MGVDSGIPHYLTNEEFYKDFNPYKKHIVNYDDVEDAQLMAKEDLPIWWGYHELQRRLMINAKPHVGYEILLDMVTKSK